MHSYPHISDDNHKHKTYLMTIDIHATDDH